MHEGADEAAIGRGGDVGALGGGADGAIAERSALGAENDKAPPWRWHGYR